MPAPAATLSSLHAGSQANVSRPWGRYGRIATPIYAPSFSKRTRSYQLVDRLKTFLDFYYSPSYLLQLSCGAYLDFFVS
jgi:hypothetical protein